ncbi:MAG: hypothetical protein PHW82_10070 [Bacteroidales bacterium]|nr:hypothetical protein [Bacteroidales bacterium]
MDYKKYYKEIEESLMKFSEFVYYEPMTKDEILEIEKRIGQTIKPLYREYLLSFGMIQDVFEELRTNLDRFFEDFDFIKDSLSGYLPIASGIDFEDIIVLINNNDLQDDFVYNVEVDSNNKIGKLKKIKPLQEIIDESILELENDYQDRCRNEDKINIVEFILSNNDFTKFIEIFKAVGIKQKTDWKPKYYPENIFGYEVAIFELFNNEIIFERDDIGEGNTKYRFELEEPILTDYEKSIIKRTEQLLDNHKIRFEKIECKLFEND